MSLIIPHAPQFSLFESNVPATPATGSGHGTSVSAPASPTNTKGTWTQLIASTAFDSLLVIISFINSGASTTDTACLIDIGIGAAAAESVIIPDLMCGQIASGPQRRSYIFPLRIPSGSRVSARAASVRASGGATVLIELYGGPRDPDRWWAGSAVTAYGINSADSGGVAVTAGDSGAETATPVAIGTTSADHECLVVGVQGFGTAYLGQGYHFDVGIDVASTSWLVRDAFLLQTDVSERIGTPNIWWPIFQPVPSGSVLVMGGECSGTAEALDFALYGIS
jgi:hypothetical protein